MEKNVTVNYKGTIIENCTLAIANKKNEILKEYIDILGLFESKIKEELEENIVEEKFKSIVESLEKIDKNIDILRDIGEDHRVLLKKILFDEKVLSNLKKYYEKFEENIKTFKHQLTDFEDFSEESIDEIINSIDKNRLLNLLEKVGKLKIIESKAVIIESITEEFSELKNDLSTFEEEDYYPYLEILESIYDKFREQIQSMREKTLIRIKNKINQLSIIIERRTNVEENKNKLNKILEEFNFSNFLEEDEEEKKKDNEEEEKSDDEDDGEDKDIRPFEELFSKELEFDTNSLSTQIEEINDLLKLERNLKGFLYDIIDKEYIDYYEKILDVFGKKKTWNQKNFSVKIEEMIEKKIFKDYQEAKEKCLELEKVGLFTLIFNFIKE